MTTPQNLRSVDLNLLPLLRELLRTKSVTQAADSLGISQSAGSEGLSRLRAQLSDEILVRVGRAMVPTRFALSLQPLVDNIVDGVDKLLAPLEIDPRQIKRQFVVATTDSTVLSLGPILLEQLRILSPQSSVQFVDMQWVDIRALKAGQLDLAILPQIMLDDVDDVDLQREYMGADDLVIVMAQHLVNMDPTEINSRPNITFRSDTRSLAFASLENPEGGDLICLPQFLPLAFLAAETDAVALIPRSMAMRIAPMLKLHILEPPSPRTLSIYSYWANRHMRDAGHRWFRELIRTISSEVSE